VRQRKKMPIRRLKDIDNSTLAFVTTTAKDWIPVFKYKDIAHMIAMQLNETAKAQDVSIVGYVIMPDHIHLLIGLKNSKDVSFFIQAFKSITSRRIKALDKPILQRLYDKSGIFTLWKRRFDDFMVYSEKQFKIKLEYIHNNPVRAGLVENSADWEFSSAGDWLAGREGIVDIDKNFRWL
jgi:putative transposase